MEFDKIQYRVTEMRSLTEGDPRYEALSREYSALEDQCYEVVGKLSQQEQDVIWAFVAAGEAMNRRLLEIICEKFDVKPWMAEE